MALRHFSDSISRLVIGLPAILVLSLSTSISSRAHAQDLAYTSVTRVEMGGAMGAMMQMVPDAETEMRQDMFMKGMLFRADQGDLSTIMDGSSHRITQINHGSRTFFTQDIGEMLAQAEETRDEAMRLLEEQGGLPEGVAMPGMMMSSPGGGFEHTVSVDRTGETREIDGFTAERIVTVMEMAATDVQAQQMAAMTGKQVLVMDSWHSSDVPGYQAYLTLYEEMADEDSDEGLAAFMGKAGAEALMSNPMVKAMMEGTPEDLQGLQGVAIKTVASFVTVPEGMELDLEAVLSSADEPLEVGGGMSMADAAREAAKGAMGRRLGGLMGRNRDKEAPDAPTAPTSQTITMRTVTLLQDFRTDPLPDDLFQPPAGYTETEPDRGRGG